MTEIIEYTLVVMVSTLFVTGSVLVYDSFSTFESGLEARVAFASVSGLASRAVQGRNSTGVVTFPQSFISCSDHTLSLDTGGTAEAMTVSCACNFKVEVTGGSHIVAFAKGPSGLTLSVS